MSTNDVAGGYLPRGGRAFFFRATGGPVRSSEWAPADVTASPPRSDDPASRGGRPPRRGASIAARMRRWSSWERSGRPGRVQRLLPALGEEIHEGVDDARDGAVVGALAMAAWKRGVLEHPGAPGRHLLAPGPPGCAPSPGSPRGVARRAARAAMAGSSSRRASKSSPTASRCGRITRASGSISVSTETSRTKAPSPGPDLDEPAALQRAQRLADRGAADPELLGQVALGRQPVAGLEPALGDQLLDLADDLLVDPGRLDRLEVHPSGRRRPARSPAGALAHGSRSPRAGGRDAAARASHHPSSARPEREQHRHEVVDGVGVRRRASARTRGSSVIISPAT